MKRAMIDLMLWAEPGYQFVLETLWETLVLIGCAVRWLGKFLLAVTLFPIWCLWQMKISRNEKGVV